MLSPDKTVIQTQPVVDALPTGATVAGRYRIERVLGQGGMGVVYLAVHQALKKPVALKMLLPHLAGRPEFVARFHREAEALARLRHRHIVGVSDFGDDAGRYYLVFDYIDGGTLESYFLDRGHSHFSVEEVRRLLIEILDGLSHAHKAGIIHRDLKPANILMEKTGDAKISDFGLARVIGDEAHRALIEHTQSSIAVGSGATGGYAGTIDFMAPEVKLFQPADERSDIYAVGVMAYWLLTGRRPSAMAASVSRAAKDKRLGKAWDALVGKALAEDPAQRFQSAAEMQAALRAAPLTGSAPRLWPWLSAAAGLAAVGAAAMWWPRTNYSEVMHSGQEAHDAAEPNLPTRAPAADIAAAVRTRNVVLKELPAGAEISIAGAPFLALSGEPPKVAVPVAGADVVIRAAGYQTWHGRLGGSDQPDILEVRLSLASPHPVAVSGLPVGTIVRIGDQERKVGPDGVVSFDLLPGPVEVRADARKFHPLRQTFEIGETQSQLELKLERIPPVQEFSIPLADDVMLRVRRVEPGEYVAGAPLSELGRQPSDEPAHAVRVEQAFYLGVFEVTQGEYLAVMRTNPSASRSLRDGRRPVEQISWASLFAADGFLARLNQRLKELRLPYVADLPTEQEWEYACRAGTTTALNNGQNLTNLSIDPGLEQIASYRQVGMAPDRVGSRAPNAWGFHDMLGNVAEWTKPSPVLRGGSWRVGPAHCRVASRVATAADARASDTMGFRLVLRPTDD